MPEKMLTPKIISLAQAIAEYEGWHPATSLFSKVEGGSVAYRNHNPGNLRSSIFALGTRDGFAVFYNDSTGFFAMCFDIMLKAQGKTTTRLTPDSPLKDFIAVWSAGTPEAVEKYTYFVCNRTRFLPEMKLKELLTN